MNTPRPGPAPSRVSTASSSSPPNTHSVPGVLKNALDFLYAEWNNKAAGFVSYGSAGGVRAVENLRLIAGELEIADVRAQVALPFATEFENFTRFTPSETAEEALKTLRT